MELNTLLKQYLEDYKEVYDYRNIEVNITEQDRFHIVMNESLAVALLTNLLKNALQKTALLSEIPGQDIH